MNTELDITHAEDSSLVSVVNWIRHQIESTWNRVWNENLPAVSDAYARIGEPAYAIYNRRLFHPIQQKLTRFTLTCDPALPGTLPLSEEEWGSEDYRERRMWTLFHDLEDDPVGSIVTRFFHDHTQLRLPEPPIVAGLYQTSHDQIRSIILQDPSTWPAF